MRSSWSQVVPRTITEALGEELTEPHHSVGSFGMRHGHGSKADEIDVDEERFFRVVDRAILEHYSRASGMPLILAALRQHHTPFRRVSHNPFLMPNGIEVDASSLTIDQLRQRAWAIVEPEFRSRLAKLTDRIEEAKAKGLGARRFGGSRPGGGPVTSRVASGGSGTADSRTHGCTDWANHVRQSGRYPGR